MTSKQKKTNSATDDSGVFVYIGPSIRGVIQEGSIFCGSEKEVLCKLASAIEKYPKVRTLIVRDTELAGAKNKIKNGVNSFSTAYRALLSAE